MKKWHVERCWIRIQRRAGLILEENISKKLDMKEPKKSWGNLNKISFTRIKKFSKALFIEHPSKNYVLFILFISPLYFISLSLKTPMKINKNFDNIIAKINKNKKPPQPRIELGSPAWQAGIIATILLRIR